MHGKAWGKEREGRNYAISFNFKNKSKFQKHIFNLNQGLALNKITWLLLQTNKNK